MIHKAQVSKGKGLALEITAVYVTTLTREAEPGPCFGTGGNAVNGEAGRHWRPLRNFLILVFIHRNIFPSFHLSEQLPPLYSHRPYIVFISKTAQRHK